LQRSIYSTIHQWHQLHQLNRIHSRYDIAPSCCSAFNVRAPVISSTGTVLFLDESLTFSAATAQASSAVDSVFTNALIHPYSSIEEGNAHHAHAVCTSLGSWDNKSSSRDIIASIVVNNIAQAYAQLHAAALHYSALRHYNSSICCSVGGRYQG